MTWNFFDLVNIKKTLRGVATTASYKSDLIEIDEILT